MFARQFINITRNFSSLSRHPSIVNKDTKLCPLNADSTRFYSIDCKDESSPVKTDEKEDRMMKLIKLEMKAEKKAKKQRRALVRAAFKEQHANEDKEPPRSRFLLNIYTQTINKWRNNRLFRAMQFSEKLVFDCSYDEYMNTREAKATARQLVRVFAENRRNRDPFDLHFCNVNFNNTTFENVQSVMPNLRDRAFPLNLHETSYLDVFPKDKLVYLTPHCKTDLTDYDPDAVYIIGAMVDTRNHEPLSMMKAKKLGIKMAKLPLDRYLDWGHGDKTLTLDQMLNIMLEWRATQSWEKALKHVPRRKLKKKDVDTRKWIVYANEFTTNYRNKNSFDNGSDSTRNDVSGLSTAERPNFDSSRTDGISDKVEKPNRTGSKLRVDIKKLFDE